VKEKETYQKRYSSSAKNKRWVVEKEQIRGITDSESCLQDTKRRLRSILVWCIYLAVS